MSKIGVFLAESPWGDLDHNAMGKGLGGRETALVNLAVAWADAGHEVYAFVPRENTSEYRHWVPDEANPKNIVNGDGFVKWIPNGYTVEMCEVLDLDAFFSWENVEVLIKLHERGIDVGHRAIEMQVAHLNAPQDLGVYVDTVVVLSEWAKAFFSVQFETFPSERIIVLPNGVDLKRFDLVKKERGQTIFPIPDMEGAGSSGYHFIYSSSPDRGLHHLLRMWESIRQMIMQEREEEAHLHICYGVENFVSNSRWSHREDSDRALTIEELIDQENVHYHGKVGQDILAQLMFNCDALLYPADTMSPTETGCITIVEALAAGIAVVTTNCDCIGPEFHEVSVQVPLPLNYDEYVRAVWDALDPEDYQARAEAGMEFAAKRDWKLIAERWITDFNL